jgi:hypothetical protein
MSEEEIEDQWNQPHQWREEAVDTLVMMEG